MRLFWFENWLTEEFEESYGYFFSEEAKVHFLFSHGYLELDYTLLLVETGLKK